MSQRDPALNQAVGKLFLLAIALASPLQANAIPQSWYAKGEVFLLEYKLTAKPISQSNSSQIFFAQSPNHQQTQAQKLLKQGTQYFQARQFKAALKAWQQALPLFQQLKDHSKEALVLGRLGLAHQNLGDPDQAIRYFNQALPILRQTGEPIIEASVLGNLGNNYFNVGRYKEAINAYDLSLKLWERLKDSSNTGQVFRGLGNVYIALGQYSKAYACHQLGLNASKSPEAQANAYNSLGVIYTSLKDETELIDEQKNNDFLCSFDATENTQNPSQLQKLDNRSKAFSELTQEKAREYFQISLDKAQNIRDPIQRQILQAQALNNLGNIDLSNGNLSSALQYYQQELAIAQAANNRRLEVSALQGIGSVYTSQDNNSQALTVLQKSLTLLKNLNDPRLEATNLHLMGANLWELGRLSESETYFNSAVSLLDNLRGNLEDIDKVSIFDTQIHSYALLRRVLAEQGKVEAALEASERGRARAFIELLEKRLAANRSSSAPVQNRLPNLRELRQVAKKQNATLVEYAYIADEAFVAQGKRHGTFIKIYIWVVQPNGNITFRDVDLTPDQSQLLTRAGAWANEWGNVRKNRANSNQLETALKQDFEQLHQKLYGILIAPIAEFLPKDPSSPVIFVPYRELFQVSFPALQAPDGTYLIQNHTILTSPAIQVLALTHSQQKPDINFQQSNTLVVGNPRMPVSSSHALGSLPRSETEALTISKMLKTQALINEAATETVIKQRIGSAQLVHFATHGLLDKFDSSTIPGAIALAPGNGNSGFLTSDEILDLDLKADLVVVSACDTGRGQLTGDGVIGLSRSILATGVPSVIITLWEIQDDSTAELMSEFYKHYVQTRNKAQALRQAMLNTMKEHDHPVNWAPFTLVGQAE